MARASAAELTPQQRAFHEIYTELVEINTTDSVGDTVKSAEAMAARLRAGGIPLTNRADYNAVIRTTCVPTQMEAGHAENALPQTVRTTVNCRILPDQPVEEVARTLVRVIADDHVKITPKGLAVLSPPSPINPDVMRTIEMLANEMWPGVPVIPIMGGGYTDSRWLRNAGIPSYA
jgi:acetylornithine deacetylase/succinyl-diaminopimelate desuccinylase-like protein